MSGEPRTVVDARWAAGVAVASAAVVGLAAVLGGAFLPAPRLLVGCLAAVVVGVAFWRVVQDLHADEALLLCGIVWAVVGAAVARVSLLAAKETIAVWLLAWCLWLVARRAGERGARPLLTVLTASGLLVAAGVVLELLVVGAPGVGGLLENPNVAASLLVPCIPIAVLLAGGGSRLLPVLCAAPFVLAVAFTGSRAGAVAAVVALALLMPRGRLRAWAFVLGTAALVAVLAWRFATRPDTLAWHRLEIWRATLGEVVAHPVTGSTAGALVDAMGPYRIAHAESIGRFQKRIAYAESTPVAIAAQTGLVGLALVAAGIVAWATRARCRGLLRSPPVRAMLAAMVVLAAVHDQLGVDIVLWWWALLLGATECSSWTTSTASGKGRWSRLVCGLGLGGLLLWGVATPAFARLLWSGRIGSRTSPTRASLVEPWLVEPLRFHVQQELQLPRWGLNEAAEALRFSRRAVAVHSGSASLWADVARVHTRIVGELGVWPESPLAIRAAYATACELEPHLPWYWSEWAQVERLLGRGEEARQLVLRAVQEEPCYVRGWLLLARVDLDLGRVGAAREAVSAALAARERGRGKLLSAYERELLVLPPRQLAELEMGLR